MQKVILGLIAVWLITQTSCNDQSLDELKMGEEYINDESGIVLIDTFSLELSTVMIDSIQTSSSSSVLLGKYNHDFFGELVAEPVYRLNLPEGYSFKEDDVFDSITICLDYNHYSIGDTMEMFSAEVLELETDLESLDQSTFYNTTRVKVKDEVLGSVSFLPRPNKKELVEMKLNDSFGKRLFDLFIDDADEIQSTSSFRDYFRGVMLSGSSDNQSALGFAINDSSLCFKMYYHRMSTEKEELVSVFKMDNTGYSYNQIEEDRSATLFSALKEQDESLNSKETDNFTLVQGGTGLMTKIRFPGLAKVFQLVKLDQIIKVELVLVPNKQTEDINDLPSQLLVYESNKINKINNLYADTQNNAIPLILNSATDHYESHPYYTIDLTSYIITNLLSGYFNSDNAILIGMPTEQMQSSFSTVILGGEMSEEYKPKLNIYTYYY